MIDTKQTEALPKFRAIDFINTEEELEAYVSGRMLGLQQGYDAARLEIEALRMRSAEPAGEYPPLPWGSDFEAWLEVRSESAVYDAFRAFADATCTMRAQATPAAAAGPVGEYPPLPQTAIDAMLDYIYEHGTSAEGVKQRIESVLRAYVDADRAQAKEGGAA